MAGAVVDVVDDGDEGELSARVNIRRDYGNTRCFRHKRVWWLYE
jgi:hypothetical protein